MSIVAAPADMTDSGAIRAFHSRCEVSLRTRHTRLVLDLSDVRVADSKLVASLVLVAGRARMRSIELELKPSLTVRTWMRLYGLSFLL